MPTHDLPPEIMHHTQVPMTMMPWFSKRNPRVFVGKYITITRKDDGTLRLNFRPLKIDEHFSVNGYAFKVYLELLKALLGLVEEGCD